MKGRAGDTGRRNRPSQGSGEWGESWHISSFENSYRKKVFISSRINFSV